MKFQTVTLLIIALFTARRATCTAAEASSKKTSLDNPEQLSLQQGISIQPLSSNIDKMGFNKTHEVTHSSPLKDDHRRRTRRAVNLLLRNYRTGKLRAVGSGVSYHCYKTIQSDGTGKRLTRRGCLAVPEEFNACSMLEQPDVTQEKCAICSSDKCNSSVMLQVPYLFYVLVTLYLIIGTSGDS